ncbi:MAG: DUF563 domain-containing protein [Bdellovibrionales bacterium]|nr:DUF563 domain-containing protein [Bdellovibrionales bacterium]
MDQETLEAIRLGLECFELKRYDQALPHFEQVLRTNTPAPQLALLCGVSCFHTNQFQRAEEYLRSFLKIEPNNEEALRLLSEVTHRISDTQPKDSGNESALLIPAVGFKELFASKSPVLIASKGGLYDARTYKALAIQQPGTKAEEDIQEIASSTCELTGEWMSLRGEWAGAFYHWILEMLPQILLAEETGFKGKYLLPYQAAQYIHESLSYLGIPLERIVDIDSPWVCVEKFYCFEKCSREHFSSLSDVYSTLRKKVCGPISASSSRNRLYISRNGSHGYNSCWRKIVNESEFEALLSSYAFQKVHLEEMSLRDQLTLTIQSEALIGPHGAGFAHALFCKERSLIMEFMSPRYINYCFIGPIRLLKHRYYSFAAEVAQFEEYQFGGNVLAPLEVIEHTLQNELGM